MGRDNMNGFGPMLKDYLDYYKISQTDFADRLGISSKHMNEIINGNTAISESVMLAISLLTDIDVNLIFFVENKRKASEYLNNNFKNNEEIIKFLDSFYLKEMVKKQWITLKDKTSLVQNVMDLLDYLNVRDLFLKKVIMLIKERYIYG